MRYVSNTRYINTEIHKLYYTDKWTNTLSPTSETSTSRADCCCNGGGAWGSEDACTKCPEVLSLAYEEMCGLPAPIAVKIEDTPVEDFDQSDNSNSVAVDDYDPNELDTDIYDDSDSGRFSDIISVLLSVTFVKKWYSQPQTDSIYELEGDYSSEYDLADQPRRPFKQIKMPGDNRAAPISSRVASEKLPSKGAFACGLPGGCGHGDCVKAPRGVTCQCHRGWKKNNQGRCDLPPYLRS